MREFLRRCPACGRRFTVKLQTKKLVDTERGTERIAHDVVVRSMDPRNPKVYPAGVTYEDVPIEREKFEVTFECHNCGHRWTETVFKVERAS